MSTRLAAWDNPIISAATSGSDFDLRDLRRQADDDLRVGERRATCSRLRPLLRLFFDQLVNLNSDRTPAQDPTIKVPALVLLDEFARLHRMDAVAEAAQFLRGYGVRLAYVIQNKAQIREIYGKDGAADIFDNLGAEIVFGTADPDLTKELEERLGDNTVMFTTFNRPRFWSWFKLSKQGESDHPHRRPLMLDQEVARMSPDEQIIIRPGMRPMKTRRISWWMISASRDLVRKAAGDPAAERAGSRMTMARPGFSGDQPHKWEDKRSMLTAIIVIAIATVAAGYGGGSGEHPAYAPGIRYRSGVVVGLAVFVFLDGSG